jgi:hypothetical protein
MTALFLAASEFYSYLAIMNRKLLVTFTTAALAISTQLEAKDTPLQLKQTSPWTVDYANERCRMLREFGVGEEKVVLVFDQFGPGEYYRITIAGKPVKSPKHAGEVSIQFGPSEKEQQLGFYRGTFGQDPALVFQSLARLAPPTAEEQAAINKAKKGEWIEIVPITPERYGAVRTLIIGKPLSRTVILETGPMRKVVDAMATCVDELMASWGIDVARHKKLTRAVQPLTLPQKWMSSNDYPTKMLSAGQPAIVDYRLSVDVEGNPVSCFIQLTTRPKEFDNAVCGSLMKRARFKPALDEEGKPLASYYINTVRFVLSPDG